VRNAFLKKALVVVVVRRKRKWVCEGDTDGSLKCIPRLIYDHEVRQISQNMDPDSGPDGYNFLDGMKGKYIVGYFHTKGILSAEYNAF
jgi:hypothetical protein